MSWKLLERFIESEHFNSDPSIAVAYLSRYSNHVGITFVLTNKLRAFTYEEIEFFLPQLCHLLVSMDNESMALEEFIIDLCQESVSGALITFWLFQTHLYDLSNTPQAASFRTCRRIYNKVQHIVFGADEPLRTEKIHENVLPTSVLASMVFASVAMPLLPASIGPLAVAQARKPQPLEDTISEALPIQSVPQRVHSVGGSGARTKRPRSQRSRNHAPSGGALSMPVADGPSRKSRSSTLTRTESSTSQNKTTLSRKNTLSDMRVSSLTDLPTTGIAPDKEVGSRRPLARRIPVDDVRRHSFGLDPSKSIVELTDKQKIHMLRSHYFDTETAFLSALEGISNRLVALPKPARLSALRAELALIARDLPAEVDIPLICPATLEDGSPSKSRHHRIVRLNPAEATSLNSAERVPYLLMVEVLREDFDFNPNTPANQRLLSNLILDKDTHKRRPFDITAATRNPLDVSHEAEPDSVFEPATGDLGSADLLKDLNGQSEPAVDFKLEPDIGVTAPTTPPPPRSSSSRNAISGVSTPRGSSNPPSRSSSPGGGRKRIPSNKDKQNGTDTPDFSALATHMRTAAQMLAQLEVSGSKRPRQEVESIKSKIIASMQNLEEQSFTNNEIAPSPTFDTIIAKSRRSGEARPASTDFPDGPEADVDVIVNTGAGAARMENDQITGGVRRKGDRDDPSAATFGEEWNNKKERIRRTSPYGWMRNWDLLSVIVKTGSDLRQELFACQLIRICAKIWEDAQVPIWVKQMRILVTGDSSGLIETITNGVSVHSLKRSLTLSTIAAGTNPRKKFATLADHFRKAFGEPDSDAFKAAQDAFMRSLAAYSMLSYILQLKDRHNGNILIDNQGHIIHIDFGFMLSNSPGSVGFEAAPFKLTQDYVDVLGGLNSPMYDKFRMTCKQAFQALRKSADQVLMVVELMSKESKMACFQSGPVATLATLRQRFMLHLSKEEAESFVENDLIAKSFGSYYTRLYDTFQYRTQGIY